jgi:hypothetical protein
MVGRGMNLADVMDQLGDQLDTIAGLRVYRYPPDNVQVPAAVVTYPEDYTYDATYGRGMDRMTVPVIVMVGRVSDRASRGQLGAYCDGTGDSSVKAVVEAGAFYTAFDSVRVQDATFDIVSMAGVEYVAATFALDVAGPGSEDPVATTFNQFGPADHGLISWAYDPSVPTTNTQPVNGTVYLVKLLLRHEAEISNVVWAVGTAGADPTAGQNEVGVYGSDGTRLAVANVDDDISSIGLKTTPVTPVTAGPGFVWAGFVFNAGTPPNLLRGEDFSGLIRAGNVGLAAETLRWAINGTAQTALPATRTPASNATSTFCGPWAALS